MEALESLGLEGKVDIAAYNTPMQTVVSGDAEAIDGLRSHFMAQGRRSKILEISHTFHSHHMDTIVDAFQAVADTVCFQPPIVAIVSSLTGKIAETDQLERPSYWTEKLRRPVRFCDGIRAIVQHGAGVFIKLGSQPVLCGMGVACLADDSKAVWLPSLVSKHDDAVTVQRSLGELHVRHVPIDCSAYFKPFGCKRMELPTYAFQRERLQLNVRPAAWRETSVGSTDLSAADAATATDIQVHMQFNIDWQLVDTSNLHPRGAWGLLCPTGNVSWAERVTLLYRGLVFDRSESGELKDAQHLDGLLCLWDSDEDAILQARNLTTKALAQFQTAAQIRFQTQQLWVTRNAVGAGPDDRPTGLGAGPLWGMVRSVRSEHPELKLRLIDVDLDLDEDTKTAGLNAVAQVLMLTTEPECAVHRGQVLVPRMQRVQSEPVEQRLLRSDSAVLVTGRLSSIGSNIARWLASAHGIRHLVLTSRRGMQTSGAQIFDELARLSANAIVIAQQCF